MISSLKSTGCCTQKLERSLPLTWFLKERQDYGQMIFTTTSTTSTSTTCIIIIIIIIIIIVIIVIIVIVIVIVIIIIIIIIVIMIIMFFWLWTSRVLFVMHFNEALLGLYLRGIGEFVLILDHPLAAISRPHGALNPG